MAKKPHLNASAAELADVAARICTPYQQALDLNHFTESGQEAPSVNFVPFQIFLGSLAQQCWRQLHDGTMKRADGTPVHNINTLINNKTDDLNTLIEEKYQGDFTLAEGDPSVARMCTMIFQLEAQRDMIVDFLDGFKASYKAFFKKNWEPYVASSRPAETASKDAVKTQLAAMAARRKAQQEVTKPNEEAAA